VRTLQGTLTQDKNELLFSKFDINYSALPARFRKVS
jgi:tRNA(His) 5'-end guanylyltransferase